MFKYCKCKNPVVNPIPSSRHFQKWIDKNREEFNVFEIIVDIYAGLTNTFEEMRDCRISPDSLSKTRNDLEFYIPQLCSFVFDSSKPRELRDCITVILIDAASASFYFSHRLYFFLQSYQKDPGLSEDTRTM